MRGKKGVHIEREIKLGIESDDVLGRCGALRPVISRDHARRLCASWIPTLLCGMGGVCVNQVRLETTLPLRHCGTPLNEDKLCEERHVGRSGVCA